RRLDANDPRSRTRHRRGEGRWPMSDHFLLDGWEDFSFRLDAPDDHKALSLESSDRAQHAQRLNDLVDALRPAPKPRPRSRSRRARPARVSTTRTTTTGDDGEGPTPPDLEVRLRRVLGSVIPTGAVGVVVAVDDSIRIITRQSDLADVLAPFDRGA